MSLEARQLQVRFGAVQALTLDHLILEDGEKVGLRGANGSGKSTLLRPASSRLPQAHSPACRRGVPWCWSTRSRTSSAAAYCKTCVMPCTWQAGP